MSERSSNIILAAAAILFILSATLSVIIRLSQDRFVAKFPESGIPDVTVR